MHDIEPFYNWRDLYVSEEDELSPFFGVEHSEFTFTNRIYNFLIHPQWDEFGSPTLYIKIVFVDYEKQYCIIEMIGEWNDAITNDIMFLKRDVIDVLIGNGVNKFILIGENVLNFHSSDDSYYEEWAEDIEEGFIACVNFQHHVQQEFRNAHLYQYMFFFDDIVWRTRRPIQVFKEVEEKIY